ncbi:MAG: zinc-binding dehydrogenase [Planctomycetia bacterium]|nr:zinc-binding dehydrogenase [Planctomycetia bacterium]
MRAAVVDKPGHIEIRDVPQVRLASPSDILIRVLSASLCNTTDYKSFAAEDPEKVWPNNPHPFILGHECCGEIVETGEKVDGFARGDRIVFWTMPGGAFAEYACISANDTAIGKIDERISVTSAAIMEMVIGAARMLFGTDGKPLVCEGDRAVVYGLGPAGLIYVQLLKAMGAGRIAAVGRHRFRLEKAAEFGAHCLIDAKDGAPAEKVRQALSGSPDVIVDATGGNIVDDVLSLSREGTILVPYGIPPFSWPEKLGPLHEKGVVVVSAGLEEARAAVPSCMDWAADGRVDLEALTTHVMPLEEVARGLALCRDAKDETLKVAIEVAT